MHPTARLTLLTGLVILFNGCSVLRPVYTGFGLFGGDDDAKEVEHEVTLDEKKTQTAENVPSENNPLPELNREGPLKKKVLVLRMINRSLYGGEDLSLRAAWAVMDKLAKEPELVVMHEDEIDGHEQFRNTYGDYQYSVIFERARANGVSAIASGIIESLGIEEKGDEIGLFRSRTHRVNSVLRFNLWDVASEKPLVNQTLQADITEEFTRFLNNTDQNWYDSTRALASVNKALEPIYSKMPSYAKRIAWTGRIAKIDVHRYYINAGESSGIRRGQLLKVFDKAEPVVDKETGSLIGMGPGRYKGTLRIVDHFGSDGAVAVLHSGAGFHEQDRVEIYSPKD